MTSLFILGPCSERRKDKLCNLFINKKKESILLKFHLKYMQILENAKINLKDEDFVIFLKLYLIIWLNEGTNARKLIGLFIYLFFTGFTT